MITKINFLTVILLLFISCAERKTPVKTEQKITVASPDFFHLLLFRKHFQR